MDTASRKWIGELLGNESNVEALAFSGDNQLLAASVTDSKGDLIRIFDVATRTAKGELPWPGEPARELEFCLGKNLLAAVRGDHEMRLWDLSSGTTLPIDGLKEFIGGIAFEAGGARIYSGDASGEVMRWTTKDGSPDFCTVHRLEAFKIYCLACSPDKSLAIGGERPSFMNELGEVWLWPQLDSTPLAIAR
jgi:hypothetical protein